VQNRKLKLRELGRISIDEFRESEKTPIVIVMDNIRSLNNIGSVFRTADAFRVEKIYLCGITAQPPHRDIQKTAIGSTESVEWEYLESAKQLIELYRSKGYDCRAVEQTENSVFLSDFTPSDKMLIVFGNEVEGVQQEVIDICDGSLEVPQLGTKHSLNVSVCAGVVIWDLYSKMS
jgi:23S rRNA (guanosine2251-2'-O)-methyltransferase